METLVQFTGDLDVDIKEAPFDDFKREPHFGATCNSVEIALFGMCIDGQIEPRSLDDPRDTEADDYD